MTTNPADPTLPYPALCAQVQAVLEDQQKHIEPVQAFALQLLEQLWTALGIRARGGPMTYFTDTGQRQTNPHALGVQQVRSVPERSTNGYRWRFGLQILEPETNELVMDLVISVWLASSHEGFDVKVADEPWGIGGNTFARQVESHVQNSARDALYED